MAIAVFLPRSFSFIGVYEADEKISADFEYPDETLWIYRNEYTSTASVYGCCHLYKECSAAGKCVSKDKLYATACQYRRNLEAGKRFY